MKKLLTFIAEIGLVASTSANAIACGPTEKSEEEKAWDQYSSVALLAKEHFLNEFHELIKSEALGDAFEKVFIMTITL
ncbi:putative lipoprotein [Spiroplasma clarkii]|uniref:Lipoprotein n=1 Tax=Spiroplasma clarkii TaxID=2139 RepID=A0A1Y0L290_9MOLU|nr:lipoprotein [Spiroplasma clarkii]ARU92116.1 putative lipoprotein [Spiroplasma clarkii]ATX71454.1 hypothetical protein SCLAR_v1c11540 [Spiroplasma clarkii]